MTKLSGTCHCGKCQFDIAGGAEFQFICYCEDCKVLNSGGHLCGMIFPDSALTPAANTACYRYPGGTGSPIEIHFCPHCATQLYAWPTAYPGKVVVRANTVKDAVFQPQKALFTESAFAWDKPLGKA